jgi:hypothetical protein
MVKCDWFYWAKLIKTPELRLVNRKQNLRLTWLLVGYVGGYISPEIEAL